MTDAHTDKVIAELRKINLKAPDSVAARQNAIWDLRSLSEEICELKQQNDHLKVDLRRIVSSRWWGVLAIFFQPFLDYKRKYQ